MKTLKQILEENNLNITENPDYGTDKGAPKSYVDGFYEENFSKLRDKKITLVEIGVRSGASLCLWKNYFNNAKIYGLDNLHDKNDHNVPVDEEWVSGDNVEYIVGDAYTSEISEKLPKIDVLIDDGPHTFESHVKLLEIYVPKMKKNGIIVIEDVSYPHNNLYDFVPDNLKETSEVYDFGGYDNRLIVIRVK